MTYEKTIWKDRVVEKPNTYRTVENPDGTITLYPITGQVIEKGTAVSAANLNKIENQLEIFDSNLAEKATWISIDSFINVLSENVDFGQVINSLIVNYDNIIVPYGDFLIKTPIEFKSRTCIFGQGKNSKLITDENFDGFMFDVGSTKNASRSELHNLTIVGNEKCGGVYIAPYSTTNTARVKINNISIQGCKIGMFDEGMGNSLINSEIRQSTEVNYRNSGSDTFISDTRFTDSKGLYGVEFLSCGNLQFNNSKVLYNQQNGLYIYKCNMSSFTNLSVQENLKENIIIDNSYLIEFENLTTDCANKEGDGFINNIPVSLIRIKNNSYLCSIKGKLMFGNIYGNEKYAVYIEDDCQFNDINITIKGRRSREYIDYIYCKDILNNKLQVNGIKLDEYFYNFNIKNIECSDIEITSYFSTYLSKVENNKFTDFIMNCYDNINNNRAFNVLLPLNCKDVLISSVFEDGKIFDSNMYTNPFYLNRVITISDGNTTQTLTDLFYSYSPGRYNLNKNVIIGGLSEINRITIPQGFNITKQVIQFQFKVNALVNENPFSDNNKFWNTSLKCGKIMYKI